MIRILFSSFVALSLMLLAIPAVAEEPEDAKDLPVPSQGGMTAHIDPETGELIPPPDDYVPERIVDEGMRAMLSQSVEGLEFVTMPDGSVQVDLQGRFQHFNVARVGDDGQVTGLCSSQLQQLESFLVAKNRDGEEGAQ